DTHQELPRRVILRLTLPPQRIEIFRKTRARSMMAYDPNNIFAKILRGEIRSHKLYEDEDTFVFLDIMPRTEGHALVVTKEKASDLFDIKPEALRQLRAVWPRH